MTITEQTAAATADAAALLSLAIVSRSPVVSSGLAQVLAEAPGLDVWYRVDSFAALSAHHRAPDAVVIDLCGQRGERISAHCWDMLPDGSRSIVLCRPDDPPDLTDAVQGGAHAFLTRDCDIKELLRAVDAVRQGDLYVSAALLESLVNQSTTRPAQRPQHLGSREVETLRWIAEGLTHGQISRRMGLTEVTVSTYVKRIRTKLNAGNKAELTRRAIALGYVTPH